MELIASGRDADVFAVDDHRVLRRCHNPASDCEPEAAVMEWVRGQGYPVPQVHSVAGPDMVLERIEGPTMVESMTTGAISIDDSGRVLAELLEQLHSLRPPLGSEPGSTVRHLDLHPFNVISSPAGPVVIDWRNSDVGRPGVDSALTGVILAQVVLVPADLVPADVVPLIPRLLSSYLAAVGPLATSDIDAAVEYRAHDPNQSPAELAALAAVPAMMRT